MIGCGSLQDQIDSTRGNDSQSTIDPEENQDHRWKPGFGGGVAQTILSDVDEQSTQADYTSRDEQRFGGMRKGGSEFGGKEGEATGEYEDVEEEDDQVEK